MAGHAASKPVSLLDHDVGEHVPLLLEMLTYRRPAGSKTERKFIAQFIEPLGVRRDGTGNLIKRVGDAPILWSSHTDTVHRVGGRQEVAVYSSKTGAPIAYVPHDQQSNCLGADCTTGVWLMVEMIRAGVPGLYVFHRGEEIGGVGSSFIARATPNLLAGINYAVAFDRKGTSSIITHQFGGRCCSDAFATSLAAALNMPELLPDSTGSFTDTANYTDLVPECTNLSVGYSSAHTPGETQDLWFAEDLLGALIGIDFSQLVVSRDPHAPKSQPDAGKGGGQSRAWMDDSFWDDFETPSRHYTVRDLVRLHPEEIAEWMEDEGVSAANLIDVIERRGGAV